jgi:hypothetical protein
VPEKTESTSEAQIRYHSQKNSVGKKVHGSMSQTQKTSKIKDLHANTLPQTNKKLAKQEFA